MNANNFLIVFLLSNSSVLGVYSVSFNGALQNTIGLVVGSIPTTGPIEAAAIGLLGLVLNIFWPSNTENIWESIREKVIETATTIVNKKLFELEYSNLKNDMTALEQSANKYKKLDGNLQKGVELGIMIAELRRIKIRCLNSANSKFIIPDIITLAYLHLTALVEQYLFGEFLYENVKDKAVWREELETNLNEWKSFFPRVYNDWKVWRMPLIKNEGSSSPMQGGRCARVNYFVRDYAYEPFKQTWANGAVACCCGGPNTTSQGSAGIQPAKDRQMNGVLAEMESYFKETRELDKFSPNSLDSAGLGGVVG